MGESRVRWNEIRRIGADDVEDDEERFAKGRYFDAGCLVGDLVGAFAYQTGVILGVKQVTTSDPADPTKRPATGMIVEKTGTTCLVQTQGLVSPPGLLFVENKPYYVGLTGLPTLTPPPYPARKQIVGIGYSPNQLWLVPNFWLADAVDGSERIGIPLGGVRDGANRVFTTPESFIHAVGSKTIQIYHNGRRLAFSAASSPIDGDYAVFESGGPGSGFDSIQLLTFSPVGSSVLRADYVAA